MRETIAVMPARAVAFSSSGRPRAAATASNVRSSGVGPIPPHTATLVTVLSARARWMASAMSSSRSATTSMRRTGNPAAKARDARNARIGVLGVPGEHLVTDGDDDRRGALCHRFEPTRRHRVRVLGRYNLAATPFRGRRAQCRLLGRTPMTINVLLPIAAAGVLGLAYAVYLIFWVLRQPQGNDRMREIATAIQEGARRTSTASTRSSRRSGRSSSSSSSSPWAGRRPCCSCSAPP